MKKPDSYNDVMKELEEVSDSLENNVDKDFEEAYNSDFKFEYAYESLTERHSAYKRRISHA